MLERGFVVEFNPATRSGFIGCGGRMIYFRSSDVIAGDLAVGATVEYVLAKDLASLHGSEHLQRRSEVARQIRVMA